MSLFELDDTMSVGQLARRFSTMLRREFHSEVWVRGQIRSLTRAASGHVYFDLTEPAVAGQPPNALVKVVLFDSAKQQVNRTLQRHGPPGKGGAPFRMEDGVEIRIRAAVELYPPQGSLQLRMTTIDPDYTLGRLAADRSHLLAMLAAEDLLEANGRMAMPLAPLRVGLVTSRGSAAEADFVEQLVATRWRWDVHVFSTRVQGVTAADSVARAIGEADAGHCDVICVIRGGGSRTDLSTFDSEPIARAIANCSVPVVCGVGHEIDRSVADEVAAISVKTPTACAQILIDRIADTDARFAAVAKRISRLAQIRPAEHLAELNSRSQSLAANAQRVTIASGSRLETAHARVQRAADSATARATVELTTRGQRLSEATTVGLVRADSEIDKLSGRLGRSGPRLVRSSERVIDSIESRIRLLDPSVLLSRGWSITRNADGSTVRSVAQAGSVLHTQVVDGVITSHVTDRSAGAAADTHTETDTDAASSTGTSTSTGKDQ